MKKNSAQKGWSSERVPHQTSSNSGHNNRRHISLSALTPFYSGRALPSKWEDAERWISSPVSTNFQIQRRPKSKSGPIVPPPVVGGNYPSCSPAIQLLDGGNLKNFVVGSPFSTGVLLPDGVCVNYYGGCASGSGGEKGFDLVQNESNVDRSGSLPEWSDLVSEDSLSSSDQAVEKLEDVGDTGIAVYRRDAATQMSPQDSNSSSLRRNPAFCPSPTVFSPFDESHSNHPAKMEIREVQVDKGATMVRQSKGATKKDAAGVVEDFYRNATGTCPSSWDLSDTDTNISKLHRENARIAAWENLQKAKAEAAIRKLEMKLEKKRSNSMDKILKKLKNAQMKAEEMRSSVLSRQSKQNPMSENKLRMNSITVCFPRCS